MEEGYIIAATHYGLSDIKWSPTSRMTTYGCESIEPQNRSLWSGVREIYAWRCPQCQWILVKYGTRERGIEDATELEARRDVQEMRKG